MRSLTPSVPSSASPKRNPPWVLLAPLLLVACSSAPQGPIPPVQEPQLVQVTFRDIQDSRMNATMRVSKLSETPQKVTGQALTPRSDFTQSALSQSTFTHGGYRYLSATFQLTESGSPSNYSMIALKPTSSLAGTAISVIRKYDGFAANPALARLLTPTHAMGFDGVSLAVRPDHADFQVWAEAAMPTPPAGRRLFNYGFVARSPAYYVTFAFRLPLQTPRSEDPFSFTVNFAGYSDDETSVTESFEEQGASSGAGARASDLSATVVNLLPASGYSDPARTLRRPCRVRLADSLLVTGGFFPSVFLYPALDPVTTGCNP